MYRSVTKGLFVRRFAAFWAVLAAAICGAQPTPPLTLKDCLRLASSVPSAVTLARQDREIASQDSTQARAGFLPQSHFATGVTYNSPRLDDRSTFSYIPLNALREYSTLFTVSQEFDTSGRLRASLARARAGQDAARASVAISERDLRRAVTTAYYRLLLTRRIAATVCDALAESESFERRARILQQAGEAAVADVVKASAQAASLRQSLHAAELDAQLANQDLASFWTTDVASPLAVAGVLDDPTPPPDAATAFASPFLHRAEFTLLDAQHRGFQADARTARAAMLPQLNLAFQYGIDSDALRIRDRGYAAYLNLNIPLFDWMKARSATRQAQLRAAQVDFSRAISERLFSRDYQSALARVRQSYEQISLTRSQAALAAQDLKLSRLRYEGGEGAALDVVTAQSQAAQARANYYTAVANYWNAKADLEVAAGR
jgi:outer membrane protein